MAKVKIQGNASGTGVVTLTAPNTNSDRTITLPDGTGELLAKDSSGGVKLGSTGITHQAHSAESYYEEIHSNNGSDIQAIYRRGAGTPCTALGTHGTGDFIIRQGADSDSLTERMRIDSVGRVTMPYQPAFQASNHSAGNTTGNINYTHTLHNIGGHFNASTGRFTAPTAGMYSFSFHALTQNTVSTGNVEILINGGLPSGNTFRNYMDNSVGKHSPISIGGMFYLNANDYVSIYSPTLILHGNQSEHFSGHLIG